MEGGEKLARRVEVAKVDELEGGVRVAAGNTDVDRRGSAVTVEDGHRVGGAEGVEKAFLERVWGAETRSSCREVVFVD